MSLTSTCLPRSYDEFDFRFPLGAYGNSSGWLTTPAFSLNRQPDLAPRRLTTVVEAGKSYFLPMVNGQLQGPVSGKDLSPFSFVKKVASTPENCLHGKPGLSSGGGSVLLRQNGTVFKIKRCGLADRGFIDEPFHSHMSVCRAEGHVEITQHSLGGLMSLADALVECLMTRELNDNKLSKAYTPIGVILISELPEAPYPDQPLGATVVEVESDLRMDELAHMTLSPLLADLFAANLISYDPECFFFTANGFSISAVITKWKHLFERIECLGRSAGGAYHRVHQMGYLRGFGSSWFGNEVVSPDGEISTVDLDGGIVRASTYPPDLAELMRSLEINQYCSESYTFLTDMRPKALSCFGAAYVEAFRAGYKDEYEPIPADLIRLIIDEHLEVLPLLQTGFGFTENAR